MDVWEAVGPDGTRRSAAVLDGRMVGELRPLLSARASGHPQIPAEMRDVSLR
jgi:hypothetical protein